MLATLILLIPAQTPIELTDFKALESVCTEVSKRSPVDPEDEEADTKQERWERERHALFTKVYRATVDPKSVRFRPYDAADGELPIALERALPALDGALLLTVMDREGSAFEVKSEEAKSILARAEKKELKLAVTFQIDDQLAEEMSPCFSYQKSETYSLRVMPLRYELLDVAGKSIASVSTERGEDYAESLDKKPDVEVTTQVVAGVVDQPALDRALGEKKSALNACITKAGEAASFGLVAGVAAGKLSSVRVEMEASDDPQAASCLIAALTGTSAPKASPGASVGIVVSVD